MPAAIWLWCLTEFSIHTINLWSFACQIWREDFLNLWPPYKETQVNELMKSPCTVRVGVKYLKSCIAY